MVKFTGSDENGRTLVGLGISQGNVDRLKEGKPIHIHFEEMNLPWPIDLLIFFGATEQDCADVVKPFITERTMVHKEKKSNEPSAHTHCSRIGNRCQRFRGIVVRHGRTLHANWSVPERGNESRPVPRVETNAERKDRTMAA